MMCGYREKIAFVGRSCPATSCFVLFFPLLLRSVLFHLLLLYPLSSRFDFVLLCSPRFCPALRFPAVICSRQLSSFYIFHIYILSPVISFLLISSCQLCSPPPRDLTSEERNLNTNVHIKSKQTKKKYRVLSPAEYHSEGQKRGSAIAKQAT